MNTTPEDKFQFWRSLLEERKQKGLTVKEFCKEKGITAPQFFDNNKTEEPVIP